MDALGRVVRVGAECQPVSHELSCRTGLLRAGRPLSWWGIASRGARSASRRKFCADRRGECAELKTDDEVVRGCVGRSGLEAWCDKMRCPLRLIAWPGTVEFMVGFWLLPHRQRLDVSRTAIIIGAGPAGLTAGLELLRRTDIKPILLEASEEIGGISRDDPVQGQPDGYRGAPVLFEERSG